MNLLLNKRPILVTGSRGLLGTEFVDKLRSFLPPSQVVSPDRKELDITNQDQVSLFLQDHKPAWVINCAAYTNVDLAESERDSAFSINVNGPRILAQACTDHGAKLIHFSTDYVFNGKGNNPWRETDLPEPLEPNWYGKTKWLGEKAALENDSSLVFRIQWLYGSRQNRFSALKEKASFTPFIDQFGAPTWTRDIVDWVLAILNRGGVGLFHLAYDDYATWYEVYEFVKQKWNLPVKLAPSHLHNLKLPAQRPLNGRLSNTKMLDFLKLKTAGSWKDSLNIFLEEGS